VLRSLHPIEVVGITAKKKKMCGYCDMFRLRRLAAASVSYMLAMFCLNWRNINILYAVVV